MPLRHKCEISVYSEKQGREGKSRGWCPEMAAWVHEQLLHAWGAINIPSFFMNIIMFRRLESARTMSYC
jgi:hypothetical protein